MQDNNQVNSRVYDRVNGQDNGRVNDQVGNQINDIAAEKSKADFLGFSRNSLASEMIIMLIFCFAGVFCKKLINPFANTVTDAIHIPGGISTAVSLMFLVFASGITTRKWNASAMGFLQGAVALAMGSVGSMGFLAPLAYIIPGAVIDIVMMVGQKVNLPVSLKAFAANVLSSLSAALFADIVVFHLPAKVLTMYLLVAAFSGAICGGVAGAAAASFKKARKKD